LRGLLAADGAAVEEAPISRHKLPDIHLPPSLRGSWVGRYGWLVDLDAWDHEWFGHWLKLPVWLLGMVFYVLCIVLL
jgi:hypothetical protein